MELAPLGPEVRQQLHIAKDVSGVVVTRVAANSPVAAMGVQAGDVVQSVDQKPVTTPQEAAEALTSAAKSGNVLLLINRRGASEFVGLSVENGAPGNG
jgi:serine protease Do